MMEEKRKRAGQSAFGSQGKQRGQGDPGYYANGSKRGRGEPGGYENGGRARRQSQGEAGRYVNGGQGRYPGQGRSGQSQGEPGYYANEGQTRYQGDPRYYQNGGQTRRQGQGYYQGQGDPNSYQNGGQGYYQGQGDPNYYQNGGQGYYQGQGDPNYYQNGDPGYYQGQGGPDYYGEPDGGKKKKKKKKKHRKLIFALEIVLLLIVSLGLFAFAQLNRMGRVNLKDVIVNSGISKKGYRNIALFGVDSREGQLESGTNSDTIMVCSINEKTGEIKLASVYRDTYLDVYDGHYSKANSAYAGGGAERAVNMLNKNLDLDITDFVTVDFNAVIKVVDLLGGVDIELTDEEVKWLNAYLVETSQVTGVSYEDVGGSGMQHLSGIQAMAYCRIRYTEGWDYKRTERQRIVLEKVFDKAKQQGITGLAGLVNSMLDYVNTSLSNTELLGLAANAGKYSIADTSGFPYDKLAANVDAGDCVVPVNLAANVKQLHAYLFGDTDYTPSETVQTISNQIISNTGIQ